MYKILKNYKEVENHKIKGKIVLIDFSYQFPVPYKFCLSLVKKHFEKQSTLSYKVDFNFFRTFKTFRKK